MIDYNYMPYGRYVFAYALTILTHYMSAFGSGSIIYLIVRDAKKRTEVYHRLVLGMSIACLLYTSPSPRD